MKTHSTTKPSRFTIGKALLSTLDSYWRSSQWLKDQILRSGSSSVIDALKVAGFVTTVEAIIDNMPATPRVTTVMDPCKPFHFQGNRKDFGLLFTHGLGGSPESLRDFAQRLHKETGYTCRGVRLAGHGTTVEDMERTDFIDWYKSFDQHYRTLKETVDEVILIGHSMGSAISLLHATVNNPTAIVAISPPLKLHRPDAALLRYISWMKRYWPTKTAEASAYERRGHQYYRRRPLKCVTNLFRLTNVTRSRLHMIKAPIYTAVGLKDPRVFTHNLEILASSVSSKDVTVEHFRDSTHSVHHGPESDKLFNSVLKFIQRVTSQ